MLTTSILLTAAALIFVSLLPGQDNNQKIIENVHKLEHIDETMRGFMAANGRRPCPADGSAALNTTTFGVETDTSGDGQCTGASLAGGNLAGGAIPTKTLGLQDSYAFDAYGHRFTYIVDKRATSNGSCMAQAPSGIIIETAASGGTVLDDTVYAYISFGKTGDGAWPMQGGGSRIDTGNGNADMANNAAFSGGGWLTTDALVQKPASGAFDDMVWYRSDLKNTCALGAFAAVGHCNTASPGGPLDTSFLPETMPGSGAGSTVTAYASNSGGCTSSHTLACTNGTLTCDGSGTLTNCEYSSCSVTSCATASPAGPLASSFSPTSISPGPGVSAWPNSSDASCSPSYTLTCSGGTLYCNGSTTLTNCEYSNCAVPPSCSTASLGAGFTPTSLPGIAPNNTATAWPNASDPTCSPSHTLACNSGTLTCDGGSTLTNCQYSSCVKSCATAAPSGPLDTSFSPTSIPGSGPSSTMSAYASNSGTCTPHTLACTDGTLACDGSGTLTNCMYSNCAALDNRLDNTGCGGEQGDSTAVGDVNGDGYPDLIVGAAPAGKVYVIFGNAMGIPAVNPCTGLNGANGFEIDGPSVAGPPEFGISVAAGDVNGDGYADMIIVASGQPTTTGSVYVVFGSKCGGAWGTACATPFNVSNLNGSNGFQLVASSAGLLAGSQQGGNTVAAGDIDGDGYSDIIIGAQDYSNSHSVTNDGEVFVVWGGVRPAGSASGGWAASYTLSTSGGGAFIDGTNGFMLYGPSSGDLTGSAVATGDINGDGHKDIIIGARGASYGGASGSGSTYVVFGNTKTTMKDGTTSWAATNSLASGASGVINGTNGFRLDNSEGASVAAGDINGAKNGGNNLDDLIIGASGTGAVNPVTGSATGSVYVVYGKTSGWPATTTLTSGSAPLDGTHGFELDGATAGDATGVSVAVGDINGDGYSDIIIGADGTTYVPPCSPPACNASGSAYVVFGGPTMKNGAAWAAANSLSSTGSVNNGTNGFRLDDNNNSSFAGSSVSSGDFNKATNGAYNIDDVVIGAPGENNFYGTVFIVPGKTSGWSATATLQ